MQKLSYLKLSCFAESQRPRAVSTIRWWESMQGFRTYYTEIHWATRPDIEISL